MQQFMQRSETIRQNIRVVLVEPSHMGNIGACARAMCVMGLEQLYIVGGAPLDDVAFQRAASAVHVLKKCIHVDSLENAVKDCRWIVASSARMRAVPWPVCPPSKAAQDLVHIGKTSPVAAVFGPEHSGLTSQDLQIANAQVIIDTSPIYGSLNLAMAVQILAYEIFQSLQDECKDNTKTLLEEKLATQESIAFMSTMLEKMAVSSDFLHPQDLNRVLSQVKAMFVRARPTQREINIFTGLLKKFGTLNNAFK